MYMYVPIWRKELIDVWSEVKYPTYCSVQVQGKMKIVTVPVVSGVQPTVVIGVLFLVQTRK